MVKTNKKKVFRNHAQCRKAVCILCFNKADREATNNQKDIQYRHKPSSVYQITKWPWIHEG